MPRPIILVRHGQSEHHVRGLTGGWTDTPLTDLGHEQARRVAARLKRELKGESVALYTSDLLRAGGTAQYIATALGVEPVIDERIREHNNGEAVNLTMAEADERFPGAFSRSLFEPGWRMFPGAETGAELFARCAAFLDSLTGDGPTAVVVTHGGTIMCLVGHWLGMESHQLAPIQIPAYTTSITTLTTWRGRRELERLNDTAHLEGIEGWTSLGELRE